jgi:hypothetical protein
MHPDRVIDPDTAEQLDDLLRQAKLAAFGDSNDREIDALRAALDTALDLLGVAWPELTEEEEEAATWGDL